MLTLRELPLHNLLHDLHRLVVSRGGSRTGATSKMERFVMIVNGFQPLTIITKCSILNVAAALDPPLPMVTSNNPPFFFIQMCWPLKSRDFLAWNITALSFSDISVCCSGKWHLWHF